MARISTCAKVLAISNTIFLLAIFSPLLSTAWWHIRHAGSIETGGIRATVPWRWQARVSEGAIHIEKQPIILRVTRPLVSWVALAPVRNPPKGQVEAEELYAAFVSTYWSRLVIGDAVVSGPFRLGTGAKECVCMQSVPKDNKDWFHLTCLILRGAATADFHGNTQDRRTLFRDILDLPPPEDRPARVADDSGRTERFPVVFERVVFAEVRETSRHYP